MEKKQRGSSSAMILFFIGIISLAITAFSGFVSTSAVFVKTAERGYEQEQSVQKILDEISDTLQELCETKSHAPFSAIIINLQNRFSEYDFNIIDVSSAINPILMDPDIVKNAEVEELLFSDKNRYSTEYGWASVFYPPDKNILKNIQTDFDIANTAKMFPLLNILPQINIHYVLDELLVVLLKACKVKEAERKAGVLSYRAKQEELLQANIMEILKVKENHRVMKLLGTQTTFWKLQFKNDRNIVQAIYAGVPDEEVDVNSISEYILIERTIFYE